MASASTNRFASHCDPVDRGCGRAHKCSQNPRRIAMLDPGKKSAIFAVTVSPTR